MFTKFPVQLWDHLETPAQVSVMLRIMSRMTGDGHGVCFESRDNMAKACGISRKTWTKVIQELESKDLIRVSRQHRVPHHIALSKELIDVLGGKIGLLTRSNSNIVSGSNLPLKRKRTLQCEQVSEAQKRLDRYNAKKAKEKQS